MSTIKGQNLRLFVGTPAKCVAAAQSCSASLSAETQDISTKDTTGSFTENTVTGFSWNMSVDALYVDNPGEAPEKQLLFTPNTPISAAGLINYLFLGEDWSYGLKIATSSVYYGKIGLAVCPQEFDPDELRVFYEFSADAQSIEISYAQIETALEDYNHDEHTNYTLQGGLTIVYTPEPQELDEERWEVAGNYIVVLNNGVGMEALEVGDKVAVKVAFAGGEMNRDDVSGNDAAKKSVRMTGEAIISQLDINSTNKQPVTYTCQLQGVGELTIGE